MVTIEDFCDSDSETKRKLLLQRGMRLLSRSTKEVKAVLFELDSFYVEVLYDRRTQKMIWINGFDNMDLLEPYLQQIDISFVTAG